MLEKFKGLIGWWDAGDTAGISDDVRAMTDPSDIIAWANDNIDPLAVVTSFQSSGLMILHMMKSMGADPPVLFLDTGFHFAETMQFAQDVAKRWDLKLEMLHGDHHTPQNQERIYGSELYRRDPDLCCTINKV